MLSSYLNKDYGQTILSSIPEDFFTVTKTESAIEEAITDKDPKCHRTIDNQRFSIKDH